MVQVSCEKSEHKNSINPTEPQSCSGLFFFYPTPLSRTCNNRGRPHLTFSIKFPCCFLFHIIFCFLANCRGTLVGKFFESVMMRASQRDGGWGQGWCEVGVRVRVMSPKKYVPSNRVSVWIPPRTKCEPWRCAVYKCVTCTTDETKHYLSRKSANQRQNPCSGASTRVPGFEYVSWLAC